MALLMYAQNTTQLSITTKPSDQIMRGPRTIMFLVVILVALILSITFLLLYTDYGNRIEIAEQSLIQTTDIYQENLRLNISGIESVMRATVQYLGEDRTMDQMNLYLRDVTARLPSLYSILVINAKGEVIAAARDEEAAGLNLSDRVYFRVQQNPEYHEFYIDDPIQSRVDGTRLIPFSIAWRDVDGTFLGVIAASVQPRNLIAFHEYDHVGLEQTSYVTDATGTILATVPPMDGLIGESVDFDFVAGSETISSYIGLSPVTGTREIISYSTVAPYGLNIIIGTDYATILRHFYRDSGFSVAVVFIMVGLIVVFTWRQILQTRQIVEYASVLEEEVKRRKRAENLAVSREKQFSTIIENSPDFISRFDLKGRYRFVNPVLAGFVGVPAEQFIGKTNQEMGVSLEASDLWDQAREQVMQTGDPVVVDVELNTKDGLRQYEGKLVPECDESGTVTSVLAMTRDITTRKNLEKQRLYAKELELALEKQRELTQLKNNFMSMISHEFRTPLTVILSSSDVLLRYYDRMGEDKRRSYLLRIGDYVHQLIEMLDDVLKIGRADSISVSFQPRPLNLIGFCEELIQQLELTDGKHHTTRFEHTNVPETLLIDRDLMEHILSNLLSNAFKYSPEGSEVGLLISSENSALKIVISDQGIGIPPEDLPYLFDPFFRASNVGDTQGTGLGLALVKINTELHSGTIDVQSVSGQGTTFTLCIPMQIPAVNT